MKEIWIGDIPQGLKVAILGSSILFSIGHLANLASGADLLMTLLQITYAFLFRLVCAEIVAKTKSIMFPIVWHAMHDFIAFLQFIFGELYFLGKIWRDQ